MSKKSGSSGKAALFQAGRSSKKISQQYGQTFGQRRPPLTKLIKSILHRYPDGGQILKELIQNADDAGAAEVKFLYDSQSYKTKYLTSPELANFQGPALYAFNDATFKDEDWEGIQNLMESNKKDDPLKVGRFGIGFNSVYHITDLPGLVSGKYIGFLDPHEKHFEPGKPGRRYNIDPILLQGNLRNQFHPFHGIFGCDLASAIGYKYTLFRFPLRTVPSKLSEKIYTKQMIDNLFESLREEASIILLFLKSVLSISVHERNEDGALECLFKVEIAQNKREEITRKRQELLKSAVDPGVTESQYVIDIQVTSNSETEDFQWLVANQIGSAENRLSELAQELSLLPWIGCAVPINPADAISQNTGRIFCFLPLPPDVDCETGLPILVHGYFGVMDNRRGLVWPGAECRNNSTAEWNQLLIEKVGSAVYSKILEALVKDEPRTGLNEKQRRDLVYSALPKLKQVKGHWRCILDPLFADLVDQKLFYCQSDLGNSWITLNEGILDQLLKNGVKVKTRNAVLTTLLKNSHVVITDLPDHVCEIVEEYVRKRREITPTLVRNFLRNPAVKMRSRHQNLHLLEYVLSDDPPTTDLTGVPLLPLASGDSVPFHPHCHASHPSSSIFAPSENCTAALLPNMSNRFLDQSVSGETYKKLDDMAATMVDRENSTQLVKLTKDIVVENFPVSLPAEWSVHGCFKVRWNPNRSGHPPEKWLNDVWRWIHDSFLDSLEPLQNIPLIPLPPLSKTTDKYLGVLSQHSKFIFASDGSGNILPSQVTSLLTAAGCTVLSGHPSYLHHPDINSYIAPPTATGAISVLSRASLQPAQEHIKLSTSSGRSTLRDFFTRLPAHLATKHGRLLLHLPLFDTLLGSCTAVQVNGQNLNAASPEFSLPSGFNFRKSNEIISSTDTRQLLKMLTVQILQPAEVFLRYLFPDIQAKSVYSLRETSTIMLWILRQMFSLKTQCKRFLDAMKVLPFVSTDKGHLKKPSELYDPNDDLLSNLFLEQTNKFPSKEYNDGHVISTLKELGLQTKSMLTALELLQVAESIASSPKSLSSVSKIQALVEILEGNLAYLNRFVHQEVTLKAKLLQLKWLPHAKAAPKSCRFPKSMPWFNSDICFFAPTDLRSKSHALIVGSTMPILDVKMNDNLQHQLRLTSDPPVHQVVAQLKAVIQFWQQRDHKKTTLRFQEMLRAIYLHLSQKSKKCVSVAMNDASLNQWIWHGTGFCSPAQVALEKDFPLDLRPQLFLLPEDLNDGDSLTQFFLQHGVRQKFSEEDIISVLAAVKNRNSSSSPETATSKEIENDLTLCRSILEWVVKDGDSLPESLQEKVLVPVQSAQNKLVLQPCKKCTYCDRDWLRQGGSELDIPDDFQLVHDSVPARIARLLGVPPLSTCLLSAEILGFEQTGPHEPITRRLNNILKEYKEGVSVFKELIQNADDAGASKVRFLVDWREGPKQKLLSPNMEHCQGPALWAYNDAVFTDKDFENINKLAGATKVEDLAKIGRFGLGFNAVYHLTDVPSFISREHMVIFDPNVNHLGSHIHDKSRPGIRINLASNPRPLSAFVDQFKPYHDVFGCRTEGIMEGEKFHYDGTLFRFPFRTSHEAEKSEICKSVYDEVKVKRIVSTLQENASLLLLYTQHVKVVELYQVGCKDTPRNMKLVLSITRMETESAHSTDISIKLPFIEECSQWWKKKLTSSNTPEAGPSRSEHLAIEFKQMVSNLTGIRKKSVKTDTWLVTSCVGKGLSVDLAASREGKEHGLLPCAGAAAKISSVSGNRSAVSPKLTTAQVKGEAFCFLPLSIATGLPVHVNGSFAVRSNRDGIWEKNTSDQDQQIEARWNESLLEDASSEAYIQLLKNMKCLSESGRLAGYAESFHELWPSFETLKSSTWEILVKSVFTKMVNDALPLLWSNGKWMEIRSGYILDEDLRKVPGIIETLESLGQNVFHLPPKVLKSLENSGLDQVLRSITLTLESFFKDLFFPNLSKIRQQMRDPIVCCGLDHILKEHVELESMYKEYSCITSSTDGQQLRRPCQLINPKAPVASLFSAEDHRFPVGEYFETPERLYVLEKLGMVNDLLSWDEICGRAKSVEKLAVTSYKRGLRRSKDLVKYLKENIERLREKNEAGEGHLEMLQRTKFLPFCWIPPTGYTLPWEGSKHSKNQFFSPKVLFLSKNVHLVGSCRLIINETNGSGCGEIGESVEALMGFYQRQPLLDEVLKQLDFAINDEAENGLKESVCKRVYKHFNTLIVKQLGKQELIKELEKRSWLFIEGRFVSSGKVAFYWRGNGSPYLYGLPDEYRRKYDKLMRATGVKDVFEARDFINALNILCESKNGARLDEKEIKLTVSFVNELEDVKDVVVKAHIGKIPLPDAEGVLCRSEELTIEVLTVEDLRLKDRGDARYVHKDITPRRALNLGAKLLLDRRIKKYANSFGKSFGQHEKLTDRLKNILKSYPCDSGILKELVQNADDAKATEIHFVYDTRTLPHKRVFQKHADEIQGPALCVYNDRYFSEKDLEGIQRLGIGSKSDDPEKTGQYGVGFNAVYHLTDCPSFLSNNDTLCLLDPHCRYASEATPVAPGVKFDAIDDAFKEDFSDSVSGYLGEHFSLIGSTMFRLPLRNVPPFQRSWIPKISDQVVDDSKIKHLLFYVFKVEAKKMLLFLNHVKKISLSVIDEKGKLKEEYVVKSIVDKKNEKNRQEIALHARQHKDRPTREVSWKGTTYPISLTDSEGLDEQWLIHQCCGVKHETDDSHIPDGRTHGLFPRGGVAALVSSSSSTPQEYVAYCFLPLPVTTKLPVHVNGHFALDHSRRGLWRDTDPSAFLTKWNTFMKSHVLAAGYAALIEEAQNHIPHSEKDIATKRCYFQNEREAKEGLDWYHNIFPDPANHPAWDILAVEVYRCLNRDKTPVLPVVVPNEVQKSALAVTQGMQKGTGGIASGSNTMVLRSTNAMTKNTTITSPKVMQTKRGRSSLKTNASPVHAPNIPQRKSAKSVYASSKSQLADDARESRVNRTKAGRFSEVSRRRVTSSNEPLLRIRQWLPVDLGFFTEESEREKRRELFAVLLRIHMPLLLYSASVINKALTKADIPNISSLLHPKIVIDFLLTTQEETSECKIGELPMDLNNTTIENKPDLKKVILYCTREKTFPAMLEGLPLLLTADGMLRIFDSENSVYCSTFSDLFPDKAHMFVDPEFVPELPDVSVKETKGKCLPQVMLNLTVSSLARDFMPDVFRGRLELGGTKHLPWIFPEDGVLSEGWFTRLWEFLQNDTIPDPNHPSGSLDALTKFPVVPTIHGKLVTVGNAKSVLDVREGKEENTQVGKVREILVNMGCPSLCTDITESFCKVSGSVLYRYVAHPYSVSDVLFLLDYMRMNSILEVRTLDDHEIFELLQFFQEDCKNISLKTLKSLPFHKAIDGSHHPLSQYSSYVKVPHGIPTAELQRKVANVCLLHPDAFPLLNRLYEALGVRMDSKVDEFYIEYILPNFAIFSRKCQIEFLTHMRDIIMLLTVLHPHGELLMRNLQSTPCIPDESGTLHQASAFYDPRNKVFKAMLGYNASFFPPSPFNDDPWLGFLITIGLKKDCDGQQFLTFCHKVKSTAIQSRSDETNKEQSKVLVQYLFEKSDLFEIPILKLVSQIKFIVPKEVEEDLSSLHKQHQYHEKLQYVQFCDSVPWKHRDLVWTSAQLLPKWAQPPNLLSSSLGVQPQPSIETVITHLRTISHSTSTKLKLGEALPKKLQGIFNAIYDFFQRTQLKNCGKELSEICSSTCRIIGNRLKSVSCILLVDENRLVKGEQLAFTVSKEKLLKPYFYRVPLDYGTYQHFFKRLGATNEMTPFQMGNVLKSIKDCWKDDPMSSEDEEKARHATFVLFDSLVGEGDCEEKTPKPLELTELYLPSKDKRLVKSKKLVCKVPPRLTQPVSKLNYHILCSFEECGLERARRDEYLEALPERFRPRPWKTLVREELDPSCRKKTCVYSQGKKCPFIEKYILILRSSQLRLGILRLMKHQSKSEKLNEEEKEKASRLGSSKVTIKCMSTIKIRLVDVKTQRPLEESSFERTCYVVNKDDSWILYIQHELGGTQTQGILSKAVNEIMDGCVDGVAELTDMLSCDMPSKIPGVLSAHDISLDFVDEDEELGHVVPEISHYLMQQNPLCKFDDGARVAYGVDQREGEDLTEEKAGDSSTKYTLAKIISCVSQSDETGVEYDFSAEYVIDLGSKSKVETVSVLDLYKYRQDETGNLETDEEDDASGLPVDVNGEKRKIRVALLVARKLPLTLRRKVIRRLYLHWLRRKNSEITDFLISEVKRMEEEMDSTDGPAGFFSISHRFFCRWKRQGKQEERTYNNYNSSMSVSESSHFSHRFHEVSDYANPDFAEASRWIKQSRAELETAKLLRSRSHFQVCFLSEQVVEKCLKAALYAKCGLSRNQLNTHDVYRLGGMVQGLDGAPKDEVSRAVSVVADYYLPTRYPDRQPKYKVPAEEFSIEQAKEALKVAEEVLKSIEKFVDDEDS